jgi:hypothetical protein
VALVVPESAGFPDNWIYVHSPEVRLGRIQNFGSWSPYLVKEGRTCLGLEYFVFEGDDLWASDDADLVELGKRELEKIGLVRASDVQAGYVVRMPKAYPVYDEAYRTNVDTMRAWLDTNVANVYPVGRNGMHRYNNQDHSMYTAMLSVENIFGATHDIWNVNVEEEYHEEKSVDVRDGESGTGRAAPITPRRSTAEIVVPDEAEVDAAADRPVPAVRRARSRERDTDPPRLRQDESFILCDWGQEVSCRSLATLSSLVDVAT